MAREESIKKNNKIIEDFLKSLEQDNSKLLKKVTYDEKTKKICKKRDYNKDINNHFTEEDRFIVDGSLYCSSSSQKKKHNPINKHVLDGMFFNNAENIFNTECGNSINTVKYSRFSFAGFFGTKKKQSFERFLNTLKLTFLHLLVKRANINIRINKILKYDGSSYKANDNPKDKMKEILKLINNSEKLKEDEKNKFFKEIKEFNDNFNSFIKSLAEFQTEASKDANKNQNGILEENKSKKIIRKINNQYLNSYAKDICGIKIEKKKTEHDGVTYGINFNKNAPDKSCHNATKKLIFDKKKQNIKKTLLKSISELKPKQQQSVYL